MNAKRGGFVCDNLHNVQWRFYSLMFPFRVGALLVSAGTRPKMDLIPPRLEWSGWGNFFSSGRYQTFKSRTLPRSGLLVEIKHFPQPPVLPLISSGVGFSHFTAIDDAYGEEWQGVARRGGGHYRRSFIFRINHQSTVGWSVSLGV